MMRDMLISVAALALVAGFESSAAAQDAPAPAAGADSVPVPGEIIVSARKRQESVLKVPVIETVLSAEALQNRQVTDIDGITRQVPGLQIGNNVLTVGAQISLRGVGTSSLDAGVDQSVSLNIDGLQLTQGATYSVGFFDVGQVEVLKGPQALFFGKNSPGGVIAVRTADPGRELEVVARAGYEVRSRQKRGELVYSAPLSDTVGLRLASMYADEDGYFINLARALPGTGAKDPAGRRYNATEEYIVRGTLLWNPSSDVSVRLKVNNTGKRVTGGAAPLGACPDGTGAPAGIPFINPADDCTVGRTVYVVDMDPVAFPEARNGGVGFVKYQTSFGTLETNYTLAEALTFTSTTGYYHTDVDGLLNGTYAGYAGPTLIADNQFNRHDFTQELRLQSDYRDRPFNFLLGGYYQDARVSNRVYVGGNTAYGFPALLTGGVNDVKIEAWSAFGQLRWKPVETLEIAGGVRYTDERRHDDAGAISSYVSPVTPVAIANPDLRSKNWSPELTVTFTPTEDLTVFGALKQGYKSGSFIMTTPAVPGQDNSFGDEKVQGGEVGLKGRLLDRALTFNTAFYFYKYKDLQVGANEVAQGGLPIIRTINAASSKVYGVDFDLSYRPPSVPGLAARLAVNWNHARFETFGNAPCYGGQRIQDGCDRIFNAATGQFQAQDLSGVPLPKAADWMINAGVDYDMPVGNGLIVKLGVDGQYSSKYLRGLGRRTDLYQPAYAKFNANLAFGAEDGGWELALIGNNLTDKFTSGNCTQFSAATGQILAPPVSGTTTRNASGVDELGCIPDRGREVFLRLTLRPTAL